MRFRSIRALNSLSRTLPKPYFIIFGNMSGPKILYILGAGASCDAVPMINMNPETKMMGFCEALSYYFEQHISRFKSANEALTYVHIEQLRELLKLASKMGTPDLLAKLLIEKQRDMDYQMLKNLISSFIDSIEFSDNPMDMRALSFLTYLSSNSRLPNNVRIINWNYDSQIEMAAEMLSISKTKDTVINGFTCWPNCSRGEANTTTPWMIHVNGVAGYEYSMEKLAKRVTKNDLLNTNPLLLSFAFELDSTRWTFEQNRINLMIEAANGANILVVIGYSFPFFNRQFDKVIFEVIKSTCSKIYYQDPLNNGSFISSIFDVDPKKIIHVSDCKFYHVPNEFAG